MQSADGPEEVRQLGIGLQRVLDGKRGKEATADLPPQVAKLVEMAQAQ